MTFNIGETRERSRYVWLDVLTEIETDDEVRLRQEVEALKDYAIVTGQLIR